MTAENLSFHSRLLVLELSLVVPPVLQIPLQVSDDGFKPRLVVGQLVSGQVSHFVERVRFVVEVLGELAVHADQRLAFHAEQFQLLLRVDDAESVVSDSSHVVRIHGSVILEC